MKTIIKIPDVATLNDIEECFPNRILSYELIGNTLVVITTNCSDVSPELFILKLNFGNVVESYMFDSCGYSSENRINVKIDFEMVG